MKSLYKLNRTIPKSIGVFGLHPHAGVTWVTVLLAQYLSGVCGLQVAVIESSQKRDLICLSAEETQTETFKVHNVTYYAQREEISRPDLKDRQYDCYVYDLGCNYAKSRDQMHTCDRTLILYTMTPWYFDTAKAKLMLERDYGIPERITFLGNMISKRERKQIMKCIGASEFIEYEPEIFHPSNYCIQVFHNILWN